jgi:hypothetical protein
LYTITLVMNSFYSMLLALHDLANSALQIKHRVDFRLMLIGFQATQSYLV